MKKYIFVFLVLGLISAACQKQKAEDESIDLSGYNMKIIPDQPTTKDEIKLIIFDDCTYNQLSQNKRSGKTITIEKQFNSMMKQPCVQKNDTIAIGKLPSGTYTVNYKLVDLATNVSDPVVLSFSFSLPVSK